MALRRVLLGNGSTLPRGLSQTLAAWDSLLLSDGGSQTYGNQENSIHGSLIFKLRTNNQQALQWHSQRNLSLWPFGSKKKQESQTVTPQGSEQMETTTQVDEVTFSDSQDIPSALPEVATSDSSDIEPITETAAAITDACGQLEPAGIDAARDQSMLFGPQFIDAVTSFHSSLGLPWWASIAAVNILTRAATLPVMIASQKSNANMMSIQTDMLPMRKLQEAAGMVTDRDTKMRIQQAMLDKANEIKSKHAPLLTKTMLTMFGTLTINTLVFVSIFNGISNLMTNQVPSLQEGGMLWFTDLTQPDPYYGLPVLCSLTTLAMIQYGMNVTGDQMMNTEKAEQANRIKNIFRGMALLFIPFGGYVPSGVGILWASNSLFSVFMGLSLRQDGIRRMVGLPTMTEMATLGNQVQDVMSRHPLSFVPGMPTSATSPPPQTPAGSTVAAATSSTITPPSHSGTSSSAPAAAGTARGDIEGDMDQAGPSQSSSAGAAFTQEEAQFAATRAAVELAEKLQELQRLGELGTKPGERDKQ